jgi:glycosyltransferase involved in cell wall biosynthesis
MRVLHVVATANRRGGEVFASDLIAALAEHDGVEQRVAVLRDGRTPRVRFDAPTTILGTGAVSVPGIRIDPGAVRSLGKALGEFRPDVVQAHGGEPLKYVMTAAPGAATRVVYRRIGDPVAFQGGDLRRWAHTRLMRRAGSVVAVADAVRDELIAGHGLAPSKVVTIPNAVDVRVLEPSRPRDQTRVALGLDPAAPVLLSLGALTEEKDPIAHVEVGGRVARAVPDLIHLVVGDGPLRAKAQTEARRLGMEERIRFLGSRNDVGDLLAASDVLLLASRTEGMPACVIEAGVAGVPVAGYAIAGVPEVVVTGETGLLVAPGDRGALVAAVETLVLEDDLRSRLGASARERCRALYDIRRVAPRYLELYESVARAA